MKMPLGAYARMNESRTKTRYVCQQSVMKVTNKQYQPALKSSTTFPNLPGNALKFNAHILFTYSQVVILLLNN